MPPWQFALRPPGCERGAVCREGRGWMRNGTFWYFCSCFQASLGKPEPTLRCSSQGGDGEKWQEHLSALCSGTASRSSEHPSVEERCYFPIQDLWNPFPRCLKSKPDQYLAWKLGAQRKPCPLLSTFWYGISKSPLIWEFRLGCRSPQKRLSTGVALYSLP